MNMITCIRCTSQTACRLCWRWHTCWAESPWVTNTGNRLSIKHFTIQKDGDDVTGGWCHMFLPWEGQQWLTRWRTGEQRRTIGSTHWVIGRKTTENKGGRGRNEGSWSHLPVSCSIFISEYTVNTMSLGYFCVKHIKLFSEQSENLSWKQPIHFINLIDWFYHSAAELSIKKDKFKFINQNRVSLQRNETLKLKVWEQ